MSPTEVQSKHFTTSDGVSLQYLEAGSGNPLVLIHGWSQTAEQFKHQIAGLSSRYRVIAVDQRGHGESEKPGFGYKIHRLSKDIHELIADLDLTDVTVLGHSMGCSVIWGYLELFGTDRLAKAVLVDQSPHLTGNPAWSEAEIEAAGPLFPNAAAAYDTCNALAGPEGVETTRGFIGSMFTESYPAEGIEWVVQCNLRMPRQDAATLLLDHASIDWRDTIQRIELPALVVGGRVSPIPWKSQEWISQQIKGAKLEIFEEDEGGNHFMFIENFDKFNQVVMDFIG